MENWGNGKENKMLDVLLLFLYFRFNFDLNREKKNEGQPELSWCCGVSVS